MNREVAIDSGEGGDVYTGRDHESLVFGPDNHQDKAIASHGSCSRGSCADKRIRRVFCIYGFYVMERIKRLALRKACRPLLMSALLGGA